MNPVAELRNRGRFVAVLGLLVWFPSHLLAQEVCRTVATVGGEYCESRGSCDGASVRNAWIPDTTSPLIYFRLKFIVLGKTGPEFAATNQQIIDEYGRLNDDFADRRIRFIVQNASFQQSNYHYEFCKFASSGECYSREVDLCVTRDGNGDPVETHEVDMKSALAIDPEDQINVFVVKPSAHYSGGLAMLPWCEEATGALGGVILDSNFLGSGTLTHELGHVLGLYHTFRGGIEVPDTEEDPRCESTCYEPAGCDGTCSDPDCNLKGDLCCDTPADSTYLPGECGLAEEAEPCAPYSDYSEAAVENYMAYGGGGCWNHFTDQQAGRMHCWACDAVQGWMDSPDCNENGSKDVCDILGGESEDCDGNVVPDECQPRGGCCTITTPPPTIHCANWAVEACCTGEWHGAGSKCLEVDCFSGPYFVDPGDGEEA